MEKYFDNYDVKKEQCIFKGEKYPYLEVAYNYENKRLLKYFILDLINESAFEEHPIDWSDESAFYEFERQLLEETFFHCVGDLRYNIYLIFLVKKEDKLLNNMLIQKDFRYARKIVLAEEDMEDFFEYSFPLKRESVSKRQNDISDSKKVMADLRKSKEYAEKIFKKLLETWFLASKFSGRKKIDSEILNIHSQLLYMDKRMMINKSKSKLDVGNQLKVEEYQIKKITSISIENYRRYNRKYKIPFKKVNLIYGENGTGKTSLLEAIEYGITGCNRRSPEKDVKRGKIEIECLNSRNRKCIFGDSQNYVSLSNNWYGIKAESSEEFNRLFAQCNYFDTSWASTFAIEGEEVINIKQLKRFLDIENIEICERLLCSVYEKMIFLMKENQKNMKKNKISSESNLYNKFLKRKYLSFSQYNKWQKESDTIIEECEQHLSDLKDNMEKITLTDILKTHINKMQRIFKLLISFNEYSDLKLNEDEIVAIRSCSMEKVFMSEMSTGQKVCLALSFMFSFFLSNENAPNVIMLDEPVANLDDFHMLNLMDVLRRLALADIQIFFTTSNPDVAKLFRRKFSYLEEEFGFYRVSELKDEVVVQYEQYSYKEEKPVEIRIF